MCLAQNEKRNNIPFHARQAAALLVKVFCLPVPGELRKKRKATSKKIFFSFLKY
jgi:hypothetical protein